jgi:threonine aldolase
MLTENKNQKSFASDNWSGVAPAIMQALIEVNNLHHPAYGENDPLLEKAQQLFRNHFGDNSKTFFVYNGTAANVLSVRHLLRPWEAVVAAHSAHLNEDEAGAPEALTGSKILTIETDNGKITPEMVKPFLNSIGFQHHSQPKLITISQTTELGTVYSLEEIRQLARFAHQNSMLLHMDGARISNAAVAIGCSFKEMITETGVDVLSFGGTKNGLMFGEAIVFLKKDLAVGFEYNRKQSMQLASKMRFIIAQFITYLEQEIWKYNALNANNMAQIFATKLCEVPGFSLSRKVEANGVFAIMPENLIEKLQTEYFFHIWNEQKHEARLMCSFDTKLEDIDGFVDAARRLI